MTHVYTLISFDQRCVLRQHFLDTQSDTTLHLEVNAPEVRQHVVAVQAYFVGFIKSTGARAWGIETHMHVVMRMGDPVCVPASPLLFRSCRCIVFTFFGPPVCR